MKDIDDLFSQSPYKSPNSARSIPQPISADDEEGSIFLSSPHFAVPAASTSRPLVTPVKHTHRQRVHTALTEKQLNVPFSPPSESSSIAQGPSVWVGVGTKRKTVPRATPLRQHTSSSFHFDRLAPLPTPKTCARTPPTKAETDFHLTNQTATLKHLRITDRNSADEFASDANDSDVDDDEANTLFYIFINKDRFKDEVVEAISPGGHITKRRARSRPVSAELKQSAHSPTSPGRVSYIFATQALGSCNHTILPKARSSITFPSSHSRSSSSSSASETGSSNPKLRRRIDGTATHMPIPSRPPFQPRPLNRIESASSATLFFGPAIPQNPERTSDRPRTNTLITPAPSDAAPRGSVKRKANRHSYAGPDDLGMWNRMQTRLPSPASSPDNASRYVDTDVDDDMDFEVGPQNSSFTLNVSSYTPSPPCKTILQTKYIRRDSGVVVSDDDANMFFMNSNSSQARDTLLPATRSSTSIGSIPSDNDEGLVTPDITPDSGLNWLSASVFIRGTDDNDRTVHESRDSGVDVDAFIMNTLASAANNGPHAAMKKIPGTPVKKVRTTYLGGDRPWQSAVAAKVGPRLDFDKKAPRKSLPAAFASLPRPGERSNASSDSEGDQDSPSSRKDPKYGRLGLGRPNARDAPLALTRTRWLMRRSSSGAFSSGSESASMSTTPTRNSVTDWQPSKPRIPAMFSPQREISLGQNSARSASGSSNSSTLTLSPTDRSRYMTVPNSRRTAPRAHLVARRSSDFATEGQCGRFEREFVELAEIGSGEFGKVIKVRAKNGNDAEAFAIKKSKRIEGVKHRLRLREEVDILKHLSRAAFDCGANGRHPNVLAYIDSWDEDDFLYIQTELCESGNLARFLWEYGRVFPRLDEARIWKIIADLSNGLRFIHDAGVIHLDLKPSNVFLTKDGRFRIGDFGMASVWPRPSGLSVGCEERGTFEREGDKLYLAPEVLQGQYGKEADVFSFGMTILEVASNIMVPDQGEAWHRLRKEDFSQVDLEENSEELILLIKHMMRTDPESRISARGIYEHSVVGRARAAMERMIDDARRGGKSEFAGSPLAGVPEGFLEEILGQEGNWKRGGGWDMDMSV
ncbi:hypothetical protein AGABI1DRAFT_56372 [Agaricus bisporus var. burnettii JB137-S8]|uniref:Protein kinase domain-containing protein n=1 Tax=Agaricus bisporus var. burnettii (strain JB137-S8 / ATCC MYA-4627 / FGSC 10392) TaxID=597362 RepID=K5XD61_AGABU|nr:uncharacterized protein AGABI1DRAFT_56372 [Agaricus bisporus var. burnettii JB137-S8]EKM81062.1 hypothetical protein AGABI1DRAFT_56372 [Agaricus bisporus var. burnettii JB137-S8]